MRRTVRMAFVAGLAGLAGAARANTVGDYPRQADISAQSNTHALRIYIHGGRNTFLLQPSPADMNRAALYWPDADWRSAANDLVRPLGCAVVRMTRLSRAGPAWEATYYCPLGTDLPALVRQQAAATESQEAKP